MVINILPDIPKWELEVFNSSLYMAYDNCELRRSNVPDRGEEEEIKYIYK